MARFLTLEYSLGASRDELITVFGEWTPEGVHRNYGAGPAPQLEAFYEAIVARYLRPAEA